MSIKKNINKDLTKSSAIANLKTRIFFIVFIGVISALVLFISILILLNVKYTCNKVKKETVDDQIYKLSKKAEPSNFDFDKNSGFNVDGEADLPIVDQVKLGQEYVKDLKEILATLDQQIQSLSNDEAIDIEAIKIIKKKAMEEIIPREYQEMHIDLIFALDLIINGDVNRAMSDLEEIKNNITK
ncbi:MAG: hypothetical protein ABIC82_05275 [bacterium]